MHENKDEPTDSQRISSPFRYGELILLEERQYHMGFELAENMSFDESVNTKKEVVRKSSSPAFDKLGTFPRHPMISDHFLLPILIKHLMTACKPIAFTSNAQSLRSAQFQSSKMVPLLLLSYPAAFRHFQISTFKKSNPPVTT